MDGSPSVPSRSGIGSRSAARSGDLTSRDHPLFADRGLRYDNADALTVELERYTSEPPA